jgi:ABC-type transporter Mla subunit MlaD
MKLEKNELRVAVFIIIPVALLFMFIIMKLGYSLASSTIDVFLKVDSISSIKKGTMVKIKGYSVGRVTTIEPVYKPALHFLATMRIAKDIDIYDDCMAVIQNQNIIGDPVIELRNPDRKSEFLTNGSVIEGIEHVNLEVILQDVHALLTTVSGTVSVIKDISTDSKTSLKGLISNLKDGSKSLANILEGSQRDILAMLATFRETSLTLKRISEEIKKNPWSFIRKGAQDEEKKKE